MPFPTPNEVMDLSPEELAPHLLDQIKAEIRGNRGSDAVHFSNICRRYDASEYRQLELDTNQLARNMSEAWSVLERAGLIGQDPVAMAFGMYCVTRRGKAAASASDVSQALSASQLHREGMHPTLRTTVYSKFIRGDYENAVLEAFKLVEVATREAGQFAADDLGTQLMRDAFNVSNGPLTDKTELTAERQGLSDLFAGAIARFKNPSSHRLVEFDADTCRELLSLASVLLRIIDVRRP